MLCILTFPLDRNYYATALMEEYGLIPPEFKKAMAHLLNWVT